MHRAGNDGRFDLFHNPTPLSKCSRCALDMTGDLLRQCGDPKCPMRSRTAPCSILAAAVAVSLLAACAQVSGEGPTRTLTGFNGLMATQKQVTQLTADIAATTVHGITGMKVMAVDETLDIVIVSLSGRAPLGFSDVHDGDELMVGGVPVTVQHERYARCVRPYVASVHTEPGICTRAGYGYVYGFVTDRGPRDEIGPGFSGSGAYDPDLHLAGIATALVTQADSDELLVWYVPIRDVLRLVPR